MSEYVIHFDGSCGPKNPGPTAGWGYHISKDGVPIIKDSGQCEDQSIYTNNYAEFYALYEALNILSGIITKSDKLFIRGDSKLVINMMSGKWRPKEGIYFPAYQLALKELISIRAKYITVSIDWIPRAMNTKADELSTAYAAK